MPDYSNWLSWRVWVDELPSTTVIYNDQAKYIQIWLISKTCIFLYLYCLFSLSISRHVNTHTTTVSRLHRPASFKAVNSEWGAGEFTSYSQQRNNGWCGMDTSHSLRRLKTSEPLSCSLWMVNAQLVLIDGKWWWILVDNRLNMVN